MAHPRERPRAFAGDAPLGGASGETPISAAWIVAYLALAGLVLLVAVLVLGVIRRITPLIERSEELLTSAAKRLTIGGLPPGSAVPDFRGEEVHGSVFTEADLRERASVVLFIDQDCAACEQFVGDLRRGEVPYLGARLIVVSGDREHVEAVSRSGDVTAVVDDERSLARAFQSAVSPQAFVVDEQGMALSSGTPNTWDDLRQLVDAVKGGGRTSNVTAASTASSNAREVV